MILAGRHACRLTPAGLAAKGNSATPDKCPAETPWHAKAIYPCRELLPFTNGQESGALLCLTYWLACRDCNCNPEAACEAHNDCAEGLFCGSPLDIPAGSQPNNTSNTCQVTAPSVHRVLLPLVAPVCIILRQGSSKGSTLGLRWLQ